MKRVEMLKILENTFSTYEDPKNLAACALQAVEEAGMKPPRLPEEDCQAIMSIYYGGYTLNQWEEDLAKDKNVEEAKQRRATKKAERK